MSVNPLTASAKNSTFGQNANRTPETIEIKPRRMNFKFDGAGAHWFDQEPVQSHVLNVLSLSFPDGERFFMDSVREYEHTVKDEKQLAEIRGFVGQEAMHSLEHKTFNNMLADLGYGNAVEKTEKIHRFMLDRAREGDPDRRLAVTVALEHITAIMSEWFLEHDDILEKLDPKVRKLWLWHAIEEIEHKAVAFDLYKQVAGDGYFKRVRTMIPVAIFLFIYTFVGTLRFLKKDGLLFKPTVLFKGFWQLVKPGGMLTGVIPSLLRYFKPNFHPWDHDNSAVLDKMKARLSEEMDLNVDDLYENDMQKAS